MCSGPESPFSLMFGPIIDDWKISIVLKIPGAFQIYETVTTFVAQYTFLESLKFRKKLTQNERNFKIVIDCLIDWILEFCHRFFLENTYEGWIVESLYTALVYLKGTFNSGYSLTASWAKSIIFDHLPNTDLNRLFWNSLPLKSVAGQNELLVTFEFFTIGVSVRLSDRSLHREEQKKIRQKMAPCGVWNQDLQIFKPMLYQLS